MPNKQQFIIAVAGYLYAKGNLTWTGCIETATEICGILSSMEEQS